jgi:WD40 repeat protein
VLAPPSTPLPVTTCQMQMPHKGEVRCLEFHPSLLLVATGSRDRTFKLWDRIEAAPVVSLAHEQHAIRRKLAREDGGNPNNVDSAAVTAAAVAAVESGKMKAAAANRKGRRIESKSVAADAAVSATAAPRAPPRHVWQCRSVGFYRDFPCSAAAFSGDGTALALGYGNHVTLWDWRDNALKGVLMQVREWRMHQC